MKNFTLIQWVVIIILSLLTALEPLSIDLYLPAFLQLSETFSTTAASVQMSLTTFLGGFAIGQLFWGPLADRYGRKIPILLSLTLFIVASVACIYVTSIEQLWVMRFIQAIGGSGGIVIARAVVTDYFDESRTLKIFTLLALIMSIAPIVGPIIGTQILSIFSWKGIFGTMAVLGITMFLLTTFFLPETRHKEMRAEKNVVKGYLSVLAVREFTVYALIAGIANGALMVYVANAPFLIMEYGGLSGNSFSLIFAINSIGLMIASYLTDRLQKYISTLRLIFYALLLMFASSILLLVAMGMGLNIFQILPIMFFFIFPIGILFPATTELAMKPFTHNSGTASALFGTIQIMTACICSLIGNFIVSGTITSVGVVFFICGLFSFFSCFLIRKRRAKLQTVTLLNVQENKIFKEKE